jgi:hypothetical protein
MKCPKIEEMVLYFTQPTDEEGSASIAQHLRECASCREQQEAFAQLLAGLGEDQGEFDAPSLSKEVMQRVRSEAEAAPLTAALPPRWSWGFWRRQWALLPVAASLVVIIWLLLPPRVRDPSAYLNRPMEVQARGEKTASFDRWVSLKVFKPTSRGLVPASERIASKQYLAFAYRNRPRSTLSHLLIFGIDVRGAVHWYYPAHLHADKNPCSLSIAKSEDWIALREEVGHELPPGPYRLWAVFTARPICVQQTEAVVKKDFARAGSLARLKRLSLGPSGQDSFLFTVQKQKE